MLEGYDTFKELYGEVNTKSFLNFLLDAEKLMGKGIISAK